MEFAPSRRVDYTKLPEYIVDEDDDMDTFYAKLAQNLQDDIVIEISGEYKVKHKSEQFYLKPKSNTKSSSDFSSSN